MPDEPNQPELFPPGNEAANLAGAELPPPEAGSGDFPPAWTPHPARHWFGNLVRFLFALVLLGMLVVPFTPVASKIKQTLTTLIESARHDRVLVREVPKPVIKEVVREIPAPPPPLPSKFVPRKDVDVASLFNGITIETKLDTSEGNYASLEIGNADAYKVTFQLQLHIPKANQTVAELSRLNSHLPKIFNQFDKLVEGGKVSGFYHKLYENKTATVQRNLTRLSKLLDRHNFFDCETILELQHPETKRRALLIQSEMDVVADGSDGDRVGEMSAEICNSDYYQPFTSYEWPKQGTTPNPLLGKWQARADALKKEAGEKGIAAGRKAELKAQMQHLETEIKAMKSRSSLVAERDPFVVISLLFKDYPRIMPQAPALGDYCAVIHGDKVLPAICGDYGPSMKMGEASLLVAKEISARATPYIRGEDDLKVTYLIFPGTADKPFGPPDLQKWKKKVEQYLGEIGGLGGEYSVHEWPLPKPKLPEPASVAGAAPDMDD